MLTDRHGNSNYVSAHSVVSLTNSVDEFLFFDPARMDDREYRKSLKTKIRRRNYDLLFYLGAERESTARIIRNIVWWRLVAGLKSANGFTKGHQLGRFEERFLKLYSLPNEADRLLRSILKGSVRIAENTRPEFGIAVTATQTVREILSRGIGTTCVIAPGSKMPVKQWGLHKFLELGKHLLEKNSDVFLIVLGGSADFLLGEELLQSWGDRAMNAAGKLSIQESYSILAHSALFIGNDSGTMHLAAAAGVPCVGIFTARSPRNLWYPYGSGHKVIRHETDCHYCLLEYCVIEKAKCIGSIEIDEVYSAAEEVLQKIEAQKPEVAKSSIPDWKL